MNSVHLPLPEPLGAFVDQQACQHGHESGGEYVRELICREPGAATIADALLAGAASGPGITADLDILRLCVRAWVMQGSDGDWKEE